VGPGRRRDNTPSAPDRKFHSKRATPFADYLPRVSQAVGDGTRRVYGTYWNRVVEAWGPRLITSVSPLEISQLAQDIKANVTPRRNARGGQGAAEHLIGALRCMYNHAVADRLLSDGFVRVQRPHLFVTGDRTRDPARLMFVSSGRTRPTARSESPTSADACPSLARMTPAL
jgi:hypothetical protein